MGLSREASLPLLLLAWWGNRRARRKPPHTSPSAQRASGTLSQLIARCVPLSARYSSHSSAIKTVLVQRYFPFFAKAKALGHFGLALIKEREREDKAVDHPVKSASFN